MSAFEASEDKNSSKVVELARAPRASLAPSSLPDGVKERLGTVLRGKYHLDSVLGVGGMAVVYKATHRNRAEYAIKMLRREYSSNQEVRGRFLREGYAANSVKHPGAVSVVDDDVSDDGVAFLVLELLQGAACDEICARSGHLDLEASCGIALQLLDVLEAAHGQGIIHRDVKPSNLFVLRDGTVKVLDFGIARVRETMSTAAPATETGAFLGTPAYMAPEQIVGGGKDVGAGADIWAAGATVFSLLGGVTVHEADNARQLLIRAATLPARSLAAVAPQVPEAIVEVVDRALSFDRAERWASAGAMRDALEKAWRARFASRPSREALVALVSGSVASSVPPGGHAKQASAAAIVASRPGKLLAAGKRVSNTAGLPAVSLTLASSPLLEAASFEASARAETALPIREARVRESGGLRWPLWLASGVVVLLAAGWFVQNFSRPKPLTAIEASHSPTPSEELPSYVETEPATKSEAPGRPRSGGVPRSCAEAQAAGLHVDSSVKIDPDGSGPLRAFEVFCAGMAIRLGSDSTIISADRDAPREYLTLAHSEAGGEPETNATRYVYGAGECDCPDLVRRFTRVRIDPLSMTIDPTDGAFATYNRPLTCEAQHKIHCGEQIALTWGAPGSCRGPGDTSGRATIDLRGTSFAIAPSVRFVPAGFEANGRSIVSKDRKTATIVGGGRCGSMVAEQETIAVVQER
jgi:serine/threonine protein kinase